MTAKSSLLQWLTTFKLDGNKSAVELDKDAYYNLADGYVCARILNQISPANFTDQWLDGIKPVPPNGSWRLRVSNLKRILQKIHDYASDLQTHQFKQPSTINPDVTVIAQNFDPDQINRLIQLILFCAINCDKKQEYIERISELPTQTKQDIKEAIVELLSDASIAQTMSNSNTKSPVAQSDDSALHKDNRTNVDTSATKLSGIKSSNHPMISTSTSFDSRRNSADTTPIQQFRGSNMISTTVGTSSAIQDTVQSLEQRLQEALSLKDSKAQACHELEMKLHRLQQERDQLAFDNERLLVQTEKMQNSPHLQQTTMSSDLNRRLSSQSSLAKDIIGSPSDIGSISGSGGRRTSRAISEHETAVQSDELNHQQTRRLQGEVQRLKEELIKIETEKEDFRLKSNLLKEDLDRITTRHEELKDKAEQARRLQDELDEHKHISGKVISYEQMIENLVKKNSDMKKELKGLEENNLSHVQKIVRLENENENLMNSVNQIDIYRKQLNEAHLKLSEETHRADKAEVELTRLAEKFQATKRENERLYEATNQLRLNNSNLDSSTAGAMINHQRLFESVDLKEVLPGQAAQGDAIGLANSITMSGLDNQSVIELKEKIARLEMENQLLEDKLNAQPGNNKNILGELLAESTERCKKLENECRQARKRIMLLESNLKDNMTNALGAQTSSTSASAQQQAAFLIQQQQAQDNTSSDNV